MAAAAARTAPKTAHPLHLAYLAFVLLGLPTGLLGIAWPTLRLDFHLGLEAMGLLLFVSTAGFITASTLTARLMQRIGIGQLLGLSLLASAGAALGSALAPAWGVFVAVGVLSGAGAALLDTGLNTYLAAKYRESDMQWLHAFFGVGAVLSPLVMTASLSLLHAWRPGYAAVGLLTLGAAGYFWRMGKAWDAPARPAHPAPPSLMDYRTSFRESLRHPQTWVAIAIFLLYTGAELTLGNWAYTVFTEGRGIDPTLAGIWAGGFWVMFTTGRVLGALGAQRLRLELLLTGSLSLALMGASLYWWNPLPWVGVGGVFLAGLAMAPIFAGLMSGTSRRVGQSHAANAIGLQMAAANLGGALLPSLAGMLAQAYSLEAIPGMLVVSLAALLLLNSLALRPGHRAGSLETTLAEQPGGTVPGG